MTKTNRKASKRSADASSGSASEWVLSIMLPNGRLYTFNVEEVVSIDPDDIYSELVDHSRRYAFYAMAHASVTDAIHTQDGKISRMKARLDEEVRAELANGTTKAPTETAVRQAVLRRLEPEIEALDRLRSMERRLAVVRESLTHRREMLTALSMYRAPEHAASPLDRADYRLRDGKRDREQ